MLLLVCVLCCLTVASFHAASNHRCSETGWATACVTWTCNLAWLFAGQLCGLLGCWAVQGILGHIWQNQIIILYFCRQVLATICNYSLHVFCWVGAGRYLLQFSGEQLLVIISTFLLGACAVILLLHQCWPWFLFCCWAHAYHYNLLYFGCWAGAGNWLLPFLPIRAWSISPERKSPSMQDLLQFLCWACAGHGSFGLDLQGMCYTSLLQVFCWAGAGHYLLQFFCWKSAGNYLLQFFCWVGTVDMLQCCLLQFSCWVCAGRSAQVSVIIMYVGCIFSKKHWATRELDH